MPATPMKEAAERYSPEMAEAFQPTDTERPATKKSLAVLEVFAERKPIQTVTATVTNEKPKIHGSTPARRASTGSELMSVPPVFTFDLRDLVLFESDRAADEVTRRSPRQRENRTPSSSQLSVNPATRVAMSAGA
jgi:hypothetical protein